MEQVTTIPEGFREDRDGNLRAEANIKPVELLEDQVVMGIIDMARPLHRDLRFYKATVFQEIGTFKQVMEEQYGVRRGGKKGDMTLYSFNGKYQVKFRRADRITFGPQLEVARTLLGEYLDDATAGASDELRSIVMGAMNVGADKQAKVADIQRLLSWEVQHPKWQKAMDAIRDAIRVIDTASYVDVYERDDVSGLYQFIPLNLAKVALSDVSSETDETTDQG